MYVLELSQALDPDQAGGKAANLARAATQGLPVPAGFVLLRAALRSFLDETGLVAAAEALLAGYGELDRLGQVQAYERLRARCEASPVPRAIREAVEPVVVQLLASAPAGLAVRSSGVCEDLERASFAGIYESFLGVTSIEGFWQSVRRCWLSCWSPQAVAYGRRMGLELAVDGMAVLIQPVIAADSAGVIFTADPVIGDPWRFVLDATLGLAARLMDGAAPADHMVLAWDTGEVLERCVVDKPVALAFRDGAIGEVPVPKEQRWSPALDDEQARAVGQLALAVDRLFDKRMDVEWAIAGGEAHLLQARPLTTLPPFFPHELSAEDIEEAWTPCRNPYAAHDDSQDGPVAPIAAHRLLLDLWGCNLTPDDIFPRRLTRERLFNGYCYTTPSRWSGNPSGYDRLDEERWLDANEPRLRREWLDYYGRMHRANAWLDHAMGRASVAADRLGLFLQFEHDDEAAWAGFYAAQWMALALDHYLKGFFRDVMPEAAIEGLPGSLLQGLSCYSVERTAAAQDLGRGVLEPFIRAAFRDRPLSGVFPFLLSEHPDCQFLKECAAFCDRFGLETLEVAAGKSRGSFDIEGLLLAIKASIPGCGRQAPSVRDALVEAAHRRRAAVEEVRAYLRLHRPDQLRRFDKLLDWAYVWVPALDDRKYHFAMTVRLRRLMRRTGEAMAAEGLLDDPQDLTLLPLEVLRAYVADPDAEAFRVQYRQCRQAYERNRRLRPLPYLGRAPGDEAPQSAGARSGDQAATPQAEPTTGGVFRGQAIAPGKARGVARKVASLESHDYADGLTGEDVLICPRDEYNAQWRRDWYSLFMVVRGLVTVQGAQLHHATQIARECGVPYVNLPDDDFDLLPDGVEVELDGSAGTLTVM
ncbi:MAG: PEP/pyruvate-binding domain-containing protein [Anaerolineae bacterium]